MAEFIFVSLATPSMDNRDVRDYAANDALLSDIPISKLNQRIPLRLPPAS